MRSKSDSSEAPATGTSNRTGCRLPLTLWVEMRASWFGTGRTKADEPVPVSLTRSLLVFEVRTNGGAARLKPGSGGTRPGLSGLG